MTPPQRRTTGQSSEPSGKEQTTPLDPCQDCGSDEEPCVCDDPMGGAH